MDAERKRLAETTLTCVREIGFDTFMDLNTRTTTEEIFFLGPAMMDGRESGANATEEAIDEFIAYWQNQIDVAKDYIANGRNNKTHEWRRAGDAPEEATIP
jgi:hypothetical protein